MQFSFEAKLWVYDSPGGKHRHFMIQKLRHICYQLRPMYVKKEMITLGDNVNVSFDVIVP